MAGRARTGIPAAALAWLLAAWLPPGGSALAEPARARVAVLDVRTKGFIDPRSIEGLDLFLASRVARRADLEVLAGSDVRALLGFERNRQLLGCDDGACLAELGGVLGVSYLLSTEVSRVGETWLLSLALLDPVQARTLAREVRSCKAAHEVLEVAGPAVDGVLRALARPGATAARRASAWVALGTGAGLLAGSAVAGGLAWSSWNEAQRAAAARDEPAFELARSAVRSRALAGDVLLGAGVVAGAVGLYLRFSGPDAVALVPSLGGDRALVCALGRF